MLQTDSDLTLCQQPTGLISMTLQFAFTVHTDLQSPNYVGLLSRQDRDVAFSILHMSCLLAHYTHTHTWTRAHSSLSKALTHTHKYRRYHTTKTTSFISLTLHTTFSTTAYHNPLPTLPYWLLYKPRLSLTVNGYVWRHLNPPKFSPSVFLFPKSPMPSL